MPLYLLLSRLPGPQTYLGKILLVCFLGVHIPLIGLILYVVTSSPLDWSALLPILGVSTAATVAGTGITMAALYALLAPVREASQAIRAYLTERRVPELRSDLDDQAGRLMADVQEGITRLDTALDAARTAHDRAVEEHRSKFELLSQMSHELRTPLNHIIGFSEVMQQELLGPLGTNAYVDYAGSINASGGDLLLVVQRLLELSQIEAGKVDPTRVSIDLGELLVTAMRLKRRQTDKAGVVLALRAPMGLPPASADGRAAKQMVLHLLDAAIGNAPARSVVAVSLAEQDGLLRLTCETTGAGFTRDDLPAAIGDAYDGNAAALPIRAGIESVSTAGLGLTLVGSLARLNGGRLTLGDRSTGGRFYRLDLPAAANENVAARRSERAGA